MKNLLLASSVGVILSAAPANAAVNLLTNGSFELGTAGWTVGGVIGGPPMAEPPAIIPYGPGLPAPAGAHGEAIPAPGATGNPGFDPVGAKALYFVADGPGPQTLTQTVSTVAGKYKVGFDFYLPLNGANNAGDAILTVLVAGNPVPFATFVASAQTPQVWDHFTSTMILPTAANVTFQFSYAASTHPAKDFVIDRAYFVAVPEPATWAMMVGGFGFLGAAVRRRRSIRITYA